MNDSDLENSLRTLAPTGPSAALEARIADALSAPSPEECPPALRTRQPVNILFKPAGEPLLVRCFRSLGWVVAGAASAVAAIALFPLESLPSSPEAIPQKRPVSADAIATSSIADPGSTSGMPNAATAAGATSIAILERAVEFHNSETTKELLASEQGANVLYADGNSPVQQVRYSYLEHHAWTDSRTGARMEIEVPREDVFLIPVSTQ